MTSGAVRLAVTALGDRARPPAVIAHGAGSSHRFVVDTFGPPITAAGWRLVSYDLRGHGRSTPLPDPAAHRLEEQIADLDAVVSSVGASVVGGVSLGAHAAAAWVAGRAGIDGVALAMPGWIGPAIAGVGPHAAIADEVRRDGVGAVLDRVLADPGTPRWLHHVMSRDWPAHDQPSLTAALLALDGADAPTIETLAAIDAPAGVTGWPDDPGHPLWVAQAWRTAIAGAQLVETTIGAMDHDATAIGGAAVAALRTALHATEQD